MINRIEPEFWVLEDRPEMELFSSQKEEQLLESLHDKKMQQIRPIKEAYRNYCNNIGRRDFAIAALIVAGTILALVALLAHFGVLNSLSSSISTKMAHALNHCWSHLNSVSQKLMFRIPLIMGTVAAVTGFVLMYQTKSTIEVKTESDKKVNEVLNQDGPVYQGD